MQLGPANVKPSVVLAATVIAAALVTANVSVLNVALPVLLPALGATQAEGQWMVDVYAVVLASLLLPIGAIGDRYGRRLILLVGMSILLLANFVTAFLDSPMEVIIARGFAGVGAAFIFPATLSTITATLPDELRARGIALWTAAVSIGGFVGILASGYVIENYRWEVLFLSMALATSFVFALCIVAVPDSSDPSDANLDPVGAVLSAVAIGGLVLAIIEGPVEGWTTPVTLAGLVVGAGSLVAFVLWELASAAPLLDVRLFKVRGVRAGSISVFSQFLGAFGIFFLVVFYLGIVLGYSPLEVGLALLPISIGLLPASVISIPLAARIGRGTVGAIGLGLMGAGFAYGTTIDVDDGLTQFLVCVMIMGVGFGLAGPPATDAIVESLPPAKQGVASALNDVLRELGAAIGIAVAGSAFNSAYRDSIGGLEGYPEEVVDTLRESPFALPQVVPTIGELGPDLVGDVQQAIIDGWARGLGVLAAAMIVGATAVFVWAPRLEAEGAGRSTERSLGPVPIPSPVVMAAEVNREFASAGDVLVGQERVAAGPDLAVVEPSADDEARATALGEDGQVADPAELLGVAPTEPVTAGPDGEMHPTEPQYKPAHHVQPQPARPVQPQPAHPVQPEPAYPVLSQPVHPTQSAPGPLGAMELAAFAEERLGALAESLRQLETVVELLERRTAIPPDMVTWAATEQVLVAERAALALAEPLIDFATRLDAIDSDVATCASAIGDARAELVRLGRDPGGFAEIGRLLHEITARCIRVDGRTAILDERFRTVSTLFSTLRPAADAITAIGRRATLIRGAVHTMLPPPVPADAPEGARTW